MCDRYSLTKAQAAIRAWFRARHDRTGNLLFPGIFPDQMAPIVRAGADGERASHALPNRIFWEPCSCLSI
jgi:hypothetical protein